MSSACTLDVRSALVSANGGGRATDSGAVIILDARWGRIMTDLNDSRRAATAVLGLSQRQDVSATIAAELHRRGLTDGSTPARWTILDLADVNAAPAIQRALGGDEATVSYVSSDEAANNLACTAVSGPLPVDLRTGSLAARGRWDRVTRLSEQSLLCALLVLMIWIGGMYAHTWTLRAHLAAVATARLETYRRVFDADRLPPGAAMRLASERIRLEGLTSTGRSRVATDPRSRPRPLEVLRNWVANLPSDIRVLLTNARLEGDHMSLRGQTTSHRDAERIVEAVNTIPGLQARSPRTARLETGGVEYSITAGVLDEH